MGFIIDIWVTLYQYLIMLIVMTIWINNASDGNQTLVCAGFN